MSLRIYEEKYGGNQIYIFEIRNYWCKQKKAPRQERNYLGRKDPQTGKLTFKKTKQSPIVLPGSKSFGGTYFLSKLSKLCGLDEVLKKIFPEEHRFILYIAFFKILEKEPYTHYIK